MVKYTLMALALFLGGISAPQADEGKAKEELVVRQVVGVMPQYAEPEDPNADQSTPEGCRKAGGIWNEHRKQCGARL